MSASDALVREPTGTRSSYAGRVGRRRVAEGSKSEHPALGLAVDGVGFVPVHVAGDTPFAGETLAALEGRQVRATGVWRNGTLRVVAAELEATCSAVLLGALGDARVPNHDHARDILFGMRFGFDLYANVRPCKALADRLVPLKGRGAADVNFVVFRENTEGIYVGMGGQFKRGTPDEVAETVRFLCGPHARWISGEVLLINGGEVRRAAR